MITVAIYINGKPIFVRSAHRIEDAPEKGGVAKYKVDTGAIIEHNPDEGAIELSHKLLNTIDER
jgi:hypothetical protein